MSTPIHQIRSLSADPQQQIYNPNVPLAPPVHQQQQSNSQLVDDILKEMDAPPGDGYMNDVNTGNIGYAMDPMAHIPPKRDHGVQNFLTGGGEQTKSPSLMHLPPDTQLNFTSLEPPETMLTRVLRELKPVVIVFIIVVVLSLQQTNRVIFGFLPSLILENGELSIYAILLRAAIAAVLFYILNKFIPIA